MEEYFFLFFFNNNNYFCLVTTRIFFFFLYGKKTPQKFQINKEVEKGAFFSFLMAMALAK
jgi:hypothetical protein